METNKSKPMECQLKGCELPALLSDRCFAYCSTKHKGIAVGNDIRDLPNKHLSIKEIQIKLRRMGKEAAKKNSKPKNERAYL